MTNCWFHPEEESTVGKLLEHFKSHHGTTVTIEYADGEAYRCKYFSSYDCDNESELENGTETEPDDFFAIAIDPIEAIAPGLHHIDPDSLIELSYRDFPKRIIAEDGAVIYEE